jgi:asparagine synthase (glutamine-hydrolysing)
MQGRATGALEHLLASDPFLQTRRPGALKRALWSDRHLYLANNLTYKTDIAFGACGIEGRAPLLDHRILEWAQNLEDHDLVRGREKKVLLRSAYRSVLPEAISRREKHGFGAPVSRWLEGPLRDAVREAVPCPLFDTKMQQGLGGQRLWTLFMFARWAERWGASW